MKMLLWLFTLEHIAFCIPVQILCFKIYRRNQYLNEYFPPLAEESHAAVVAYTLAAAFPVVFALLPFLQFLLFKKYNEKFHPWSILINPTAVTGRAKGIGRRKDAQDYPRDFWRQIEDRVNLL
jgi:hypothetical protein